MPDSEQNREFLREVIDGLLKAVNTPESFAEYQQASDAAFAALDLTIKHAPLLGVPDAMQLGTLVAMLAYTLRAASEGDGAKYAALVLHFASQERAVLFFGSIAYRLGYAQAI